MSFAFVAEPKYYGLHEGQCLLMRMFRTFHDLQDVWMDSDVCWFLFMAVVTYACAVDLNRKGLIELASLQEPDSIQESWNAFMGFTVRFEKSVWLTRAAWIEILSLDWAESAWQEDGELFCQ
jgi:hypothetical protein